MKFIHLSDLHLGKRVNEISMLDDQKYILLQILRIIDTVQPDALLISGDVYDKSIPSAEAVTLFDDFLYRLAKRRLPVLIISGNHDSPERLAFGGRLMQSSGIHISKVYDGDLQPITLTDAFGEVHFWLLPFLKPIHVRQFFRRKPSKATRMPAPPPSSICRCGRTRAMCSLRTSSSPVPQPASRKRYPWAARTT